MAILDTIVGGINSAINTVGDFVGDALTTIDPRTNDDTTLSQSKYDFTYKVFPNDLGMDYLGHYMVFNINVPVYPSTTVPRGSNTITSQYGEVLNDFSKVDVLRFGDTNVGDASTNRGFYLPRRTRRITQSIALYMPGTQLIYGGKNIYEEVSLSALGGQLLSGVASTAAGVIYGLAAASRGASLGDALNAGATAGSRAGNIIDGAGNVAGRTLQLAGAPINPQVEVLFSTTALRDFQFEFLMIPRNEQEAQTIREIVKTFRFHAAPEVVGGGFFFVPPAEFDLTFYHRGVENTNIPRINTCVLIESEVDYAPGLGIWQTYRDGSPFATRLRLVFRELEVVHKLRVLQGF